MNNNYETKESVLAITVALLFIYKFTELEWFLNIALIIGITGLLSNLVSKRISLIWFQLARTLSLIIPNLLLSFVFYLFLTPISFLSKVFGTKDQLKLKNTEKSLFKTKTSEFDKKSFEKPY